MTSVELELARLDAELGGARVPLERTLASLPSGVGRSLPTISPEFLGFPR